MRVKTSFYLIIMLLITTSLFALPFQDGEKLTYSIKYGIIKAGTATFEAKSSTYQNKPVWHLCICAQTYPFFDPVYKIRDKIESWWDKKTLLPYKSSKQLHEGRYRQYRIHYFDQANRKTTYMKWNYKEEKWKTEEKKLPFETQDIVSSFYELRTRSLKPGDRPKLYVTTDGKSVTTTVKVLRREKVSSIFGNVNCLVLEPDMKSAGIFKGSSKLLIWVTDDAYKIPVKVESSVSIGTFVVQLEAAQNVPYTIKK
jgi:hypothetical protein